MKVLACTVEVIPCPSESEVWIDFATAIDFAALGIDTHSAAYALMWGFAAVFVPWTLGYATGIAKGLIKKL